MSSSARIVRRGRSRRARRDSRRRAPASSRNRRRRRHSRCADGRAPRRGRPARASPRHCRRRPGRSSGSGVRSTSTQGVRVFGEIVAARGARIGARRQDDAVDAALHQRPHDLEFDRRDRRGCRTGTPSCQAARIPSRWRRRCRRNRDCRRPRRRCRRSGFARSSGRARRRWGCSRCGRWRRAPRCAVAGATRRVPLTTCETVDTETCAWRAMSTIVVIDASRSRLVTLG